jgi:hypothetical protein
MSASRDVATRWCEPVLRRAGLAVKQVFETQITQISQIKAQIIKIPCRNVWNNFERDILIRALICEICVICVSTLLLVQSAPAYRIRTHRETVRRPEIGRQVASSEWRSVSHPGASPDCPGGGRACDCRGVMRGSTLA